MGWYLHTPRHTHYKPIILFQSFVLTLYFTILCSMYVCTCIHSTQILKWQSSVGALFIRHQGTQFSVLTFTLTLLHICSNTVWWCCSLLHTVLEYTPLHPIHNANWLQSSSAIWTLHSSIIRERVCLQYIVCPLNEY